MAGGTGSVPQDNGGSAGIPKKTDSDAGSSQNEQQEPISEAEIKEKVNELCSRLEQDSTSKRLLKPKDLEFLSLRRFIRARDGDVDAAFEQAKQVLKWRSAHKVDLILERDYEFAAQERWGAAYWHGRDIYGRPILVLRACRHDRALFKTATTQRYLIWKLESKLMESDVDDVVLIFDCINMTRHNLDTRLLMTMIRLLKSFYPERLGLCLVYPTPPTIWMLFKAASKLLDERTEKKIVCVRGKKRENKFLGLIHPDQLQRRFGGNDNTEYGSEGLSLVSPSQLENELDMSGNAFAGDGENGSTEQQPTLNHGLGDDFECLGPEAFDDLIGDENLELLDPDAAVREHRGSIFGKEEELKQMIDKREDEKDRFQLGLRYQVSHFHLESDSDADTSSFDTGASPRSNVAGYTDRQEHTPGHVRSINSDGGKSSRGRKRRKVKRFFRRHILRKNDTDALALSGATKPGAGRSSSSPAKVPEDRTAAEVVELSKSQEILEESVRSPTSPPYSPRTNVVRRSLSMKSATRAGLKRGGSTTKLNSGSPRLAAFSKRTSSFMGSPRRSLRKTTSSTGSTDLMDEVQFVMEAGASMKKVARDDPDRPPNTWCPVSADRFNTRVGPDYKKNKSKAPSGTSIYECVCCDVWSLASKRPHIASYMQLPERFVKPANRPDLAPIPELLIVNMMMPSYQPNALGKKRIDGPGQSIVIFAKLSSWAKQNLEDPAVQLFSRFVHACDGDQFRERLKMITRLENPEELGFDWKMQGLLSRYNGVPWLVRPEYEFHKGRGYFEIDIDYHLFKYFILKVAVPTLAKITNPIMDCALIIQAEGDAEMPERVLVGVTIRDLQLRAAPEIDLVQMDKTKEKRNLLRQATSFIDRDGTVHDLNRSSSRVSATDRAEIAKTAAVAQQLAEALGGGTLVPNSTSSSIPTCAAAQPPSSGSQIGNCGTEDSPKQPRSVFRQAMPFITNFLKAGLLMAFLVAILSYWAAAGAGFDLFFQN